MKKYISCTFLFLFWIIFPTPTTAQVSSVVINEFSHSSSTEWVELLNTTTSAINLSGYQIKNGPTILKTLSGTIPKSGLLTFDLIPGSLADSGDCLILFDASNNPLASISYGTGSCGSGDNFGTAANSLQSIGLTNGTTWSLLTSPSKGWCNDGFGGCPSISTIVSAITSGGVTTNLGSQSDYSRITGLYFEKTGYGRIAFSSELNFTDSDALSWMQSLDTKLNLGTVGTIGLDADLIKNLMSTEASLTMYNLTLSNPEIFVNGAVDNGGVVSNFNYNQSAGTATFTAAHFTTFSAHERSTSSSSSIAVNGTPSCGNSVPTAPDLFEIRRSGSKATLYFAPATGNLDYYYISYGETKDKVERYRATFGQGQSGGVLKYTINYLKPGQRYFFKVRAGNGCMPGSWSNIMYSKIGQSYRYNQKIL